jgi:hypothetical protein
MSSGSLIRGRARVGAGPWREGMGGGTRDDDEATDWLGASDRVGSAGTLNVSFGRLGPAPAPNAGSESTFVFGVSALSEWTLILGPSVDACVVSCGVLLDVSSTCSAALASVVATSLDLPDHQEERY